MQPMSHDDAAAAIGAAVAANGAEGLAAGAAAAPGVAALAPAGAEEVSTQAVARFATDASETLAELAAAQDEIIQAGTAVTQIVGHYNAVDDGAAGTLT